MSELGINYHLSLETHKNQLFLAVAIREGRKRFLYRDTLQALARGKDQAAVVFLIREHLRHLSISPLSSRADTVAFNTSLIPAGLVQEATKILAETGKLFWQEKKLLVDPFTSIKFYFNATYLEKDRLVVEGCFQKREREILFSQCEGVFPAQFVILEGILYFYSEKIEEKWLKISPLEGKKKDQFLEEFEGDETVRWKNQLVSKSEPLPYLLLTDRTGAFANLGMHYDSYGKVFVHDPLVSSWRQLEVERSWEKDLLETGFIKKIVGNSHYYCPLDKVMKGLTFLMEIGWQIFDIQGRRVIKPGERKFLLKEDKEDICVEGKIFYEGQPVDFFRVLAAFHKKEAWIDLNPTTVGLVELGEEEIPSALRVKKSQFGLLESLVKQPYVESELPIKTLFKRLQGLSLGIGSVQPSPTFAGHLHPYQEEGLNWLHFLYEGGFHGLLADEMGLGKTVQVLALISRLYPNNLKNREFNKEAAPIFCSGESDIVREQGANEDKKFAAKSTPLKTDSSDCLGIEGTLPLLIVMPTSLLFNWRKEFEKFLPEQKVYVHAGKERYTTVEELKQQRIILTSYALLRQDATLLQSLSYECVVLDEAQCIKNDKSQTAQSSFLLRSKLRLAITGTPIENKWEDLWSLFYFLDPELLGKRKEFVAAQGDDRQFAEMKKCIRPFILRRRKDQIAHQLPPKYEQLIWVDMQQAQRKLYEEWMAKHRRDLLKKIEREGPASHRMEILEAILRLRQICCHPHLVLPTLEGDLLELSAKLERLIADLDSVVQEGHKVLVYSQFTQMLRLIEKQVQHLGWSYVYLDGSSQDRESLVQRFQEDPHTSIFLMSLKAGGVGLNLTAADYVFLFDPWWNEAVEAQAIDRAHRFGRKTAVIARRYITASSIEEKMMSLKQRKSSLSQQLFDFDSSSPLTLDDLYALLS